MSNTKEKIDEIEEAAGISFAVESTEQMFHIFKDWHTQLIGVLSHMLTIPPGTELEDSEGTKHVLADDYLAGFKSGVEVALIELSTFPIQTSKEDVPA